VIRNIGILCQDRNSFGFVLGLQRRFGCHAEVFEPTGVPLQSTMLTRAQAKLASLQMEQVSADLIIRFTDADRLRWQNVKRHELEMFPPNVRPFLVCGVAVNNVEEWLALDLNYLAHRLSVPVELLQPVEDRSGVIKRAIANLHRLDHEAFEIVANIVVNAPPEVFKTWLRDESFASFYSDCRAQATRVGCQVTNEL
jgi:hypothetical protein